MREILREILAMFEGFDQVSHLSLATKSKGKRSHWNSLLIWPPIQFLLGFPTSRNVRNVWAPEMSLSLQDCLSPIAFRKL